MSSAGTQKRREAGGAFQSSRLPAASPRMTAFSRLPWILGMEAILLLILAYPLRLKQEWLLSWLDSWRAFEETSVWARFCIGQFEPFFSFFHSPLIMKGVLGGICGIGMIAATLALQALRPVMPSLGSVPRNPIKPWAFASWLAFIAWAAASAFWSPTPKLSLEGLNWVIGFGALGYLLLRRGLTDGEVRQLTVLLMLLGTAVAVICLMEATEFPRRLVFNFLYEFPDSRNRYGSLIGHNSAVGAFMLITCFPAMAMVADAKTKMGRILCTVYLGLALTAALVTQSRSTWGFGTVLGTIFILMAARMRGRNWPWRFVFYAAATLVLAFLSQTVQTDWNPLYVRNSPVVRRLKDMTPEALKGEARLRLFICSLPLVEEKPLIGHGLYAFQYVYPKAQGEYFALHPDSKLNRTTNRSHMAHNEYLQVLIEQGAVGLILIALAFGEIFLRGWRLTSRLQGPPQLLRRAFGFSAMGICLDALANFPFHVPQLAGPLLFCFAAFCSTRNEAPETAAGTEAPPGSVPAGGEPRQSPSPLLFRQEHVARLVVACAIFMGLPFVCFPFARAFQADIEFVCGDSYLNSIRQDGMQMAGPVRDEFFSKGMKGLRRAAMLQPSHASALYSLGEAHYLHGYYLALQEKQASGGIPPLYASAIEEVQSGIDDIRKSLAELRYHNSYYGLAMCYESLRNFVSDPKDKERYSNEFRNNLEEALYYAPTLPEAAIMLDRWLSSQPNPDLDRALKLRKTVYRYAPFTFRRIYQQFYFKKLDYQDFRGAAEGSEVLLQVDPTQPYFLIFALDAHMRAGDHQRVLELVQTLRDYKAEPDLPGWKGRPYRKSFAGLYEAIIRKDWPSALEALDVAYLSGARIVAMLTAVETYAREQTGLVGIPSRFKQPADYAPLDPKDWAPFLADPKSWERFLAEEKCDVLMNLMHDPGKARAAFEERLAMPGPAPSIRFWVNYAYWARDAKDEARFNMCLREIRSRDRNHPAPSFLTAASGGQKP